MKVAVLMGSDSDWPILKPAVELLKQFDIEAEVVVASAHRTPAKVREFVVSAPDKGIGAFIVAAGAAAHLAGVVASYTTLPVIGIPIKSSTLDGLDALLSTVQMPSGIPVATVAIDGAENAALLAISILSLSDDSLAAALAAARQKAAAAVLEKNKAVEVKFNG